MQQHSEKQHSANWQVFETADEVAAASRDLMMQAAQHAIKKNGVFKIVLAGGTTPENVYRLLAKEPCEWQYWHFYLGDERCLPEDHAERNSQMALQTLLSKIEIPEENIHFIPAEKGAQQAAKEYSNIVKSALPFDMVLLGMGEDGHTASLFPGHKHNENELVHAVYNAPKPPPERVSLSRKALSQNRHLLILVTGESKRHSVSRWKKGENLPVSSIRSLNKMDILLDSKAYPSA